MSRLSRLEANLTLDERRVYQSLVDRGVAPEDAVEDALDGVSIEEARRFKNSFLDGKTAGRTIARGDHLVDLNYRDEKVIRLVAEKIPAGARLVVKSDGMVYGSDEPSNRSADG